MNSVRPPNLGDYVRALRTRSTPPHPDGLTRNEFAANIFWSVSHITQIERNESTSPSVEFLDAAATELGLDRIQRRHLYNLARRTQTERETSTTAWTVDEYRALVTPEMRTVIAALDPHLVAYLDEQWNVIECNAAYDRAFPGLVDDGNVLRWFFSTPKSKQVMVQWEAEATLTVNWFRALMGRYYNPEWGIETLDELSQFPAFRQLWEKEDVRFGRHQPYMHLRDPNSDEEYRIHVQIHTEMQGDYPMQMYLGVRIPSTE
ncbi:helix-turn-helix transcriptional regulator [Rhodococcus sp. H29-C3]|uniref:helix-turn-helix domain-containing protein n=1 Tax=Rhodococcus sp. H29-C3 TaxID=3046307 RepID=UPI0024BB9B48|nr:helix-turn-helix transcriptional regulator [Rhodococcus sp. H29-C3]MDJ0362295.1 helix-turn-helix transcriptional regulator [Rhodococcus sp. H29-C3]